MRLMPSQVAILLGVQQRDILVWPNLRVIKEGRRLYISDEDLADYLAENAECVGRVYCEDLPGYLTTMRQKLVDMIEERRMTYESDSSRYSKLSGR